MNIRRTVLAACLATAALTMGACQSSQKASDAGSMAVKADNSACPIAGGPVNASLSPIAYKGKNVGFCCAGCAGKFTKMSDAEKDTVIATMK